MADIEKVKEVFGKVFESFKDDMNDADAAKVREYSDDINGIIESVVDVFSDGLQLEDVTKIGEIVGPVMKLAASFNDYSGEEKKRFVQEVLWLVYRTVDTYPDGNRNNINIPFVMGSLELKLERGLLMFASGMAIDALYKRMKKDDEV